MGEYYLHLNDLGLGKWTGYCGVGIGGGGHSRWRKRQRCGKVHDGFGESEDPAYLGCGIYVEEPVTHVWVETGQASSL